MDDDAWLGSLLLDEPMQTEELIEFGGLPAWSTDTNIAAGLGWRRNVLLAESSPVDSAFGQIELDAFALRPRQTGPMEIMALLYSEFRYYEDVPGLNSESLSVGQAQLDFEITDSFEIGARFEGLYSEQAFDALEEEFETLAATVKIWRPEWGLRAERFFDGIGTLGLEVNLGNARYDQGSEDYDFTDEFLTFSRKISDANELRIELGSSDERYDERMERASVGLLSEETLLQLKGRWWLATWRSTIDRGIFRSANTKLLFEEERGALGDYYDRDRWQLRQGVSLAWGEWDLDLGLAYTKSDYTSRRIDALADEIRSDEGWSWSLEMKRPLGERSNLVMRFDSLDKQSNAVGLAYEGSSLFLGWQFHGSRGY